METLNNDLTAPSNPTPSKRESKKIKKLTITDIPTIAAVATIIGVIATIAVAFFGDNLIGRLITKEGNNGDTQISNDTSNEDYIESITDTSINELLNKLWEDSNYVRSEYVKNLINSGITYYNRGDFSSAGALFEQAIKEGDEGVTAKNNLSFMIRRQEYISENYKLYDLLEQCKESGGAFAIINYAMYLVSIDKWEEADSQFRMLKYSDPELKECINWWKKLYSQGDCEGSLVLGWMLKYGFYEDEKRLVSDYFLDAKKNYQNMPDFLYSESNANHKYDV